MFGCQIIYSCVTPYSLVALTTKGTDVPGRQRGTPQTHLPLTPSKPEPCSPRERSPADDPLRCATSYDFKPSKTTIRRQLVHDGLLWGLEMRKERGNTAGKKTKIVLLCVYSYGPDRHKIYRKNSEYIKPQRPTLAFYQPCFIFFWVRISPCASLLSSPGWCYNSSAPTSPEIHRAPNTSTAYEARERPMIHLARGTIA